MSRPACNILGQGLKLIDERFFHWIHPELIPVRVGLEQVEIRIVGFEEDHLRMLRFPCLLVEFVKSVAVAGEEGGGDLLPDAEALPEFREFQLLRRNQQVIPILIGQQFRQGFAGEGHVVPAAFVLEVLKAKVEFFGVEEGNMPPGEKSPFFGGLDGCELTVRIGCHGFQPGIPIQRHRTLF